MKKTKILVATLTAATLALGCAAFVACGDTDPVLYDVTFNANGGTYAENKNTVTLKTDENGKIATPPADPTRAEYTFVAYSTTKDDAQTKITIKDYKFTKNTTVYALWTAAENPPTEYDITLNVGTNGTLGGDTTLTTVEGKLASLPTPAANNGYYFKGWYDAATDGTEVTTDTVFEADGTIYAQYGAEVTVTLNAGTNGTLDGNTTLTTVEGKLASLPVPTANNGHYFLGWYDAAEDGTAVTANTVFTQNGTTIYAQYGTGYTITLNAGTNGTLAGEATVVAPDGKLASLPAAAIANNGYYFKGWYDAAEEGTEVTTDTEFTQNDTIYAYYGTEVTITLNANGGTLAGEATVTLRDGALLSALPEAPTHADVSGVPQQFKGWYTAATEGEKITTATVFSEDITIYAQWQDKNGVYSPEGAYLAELEEVSPDAGFSRQMNAVVELGKGEAVVLKIDGVIVTHQANTHELWTDGAACHGIIFDQAAASFTARGTFEYKIYAHYWGDPATKDGWTITMTDGQKDPNGVYFVGQKFEIDGSYVDQGWGSSEERYIDPDNGLIVVFTTDTAFKASTLSDGSLLWDYNDSAKYAYGEGTTSDDITLPGSGNGTVKVAGTYKLTVDGDGIVTITKVVTPPAGGETEGGEQEQA